MSGLTRRRVAGMSSAMMLTALAAWLGKPVRHIDPARAAQRLDQLFPAQFGAWHAQAQGDALVRPDSGAKTYDLYDQVLERHYANSGGQRLMLSVAYGAEQSAALQVHRPEVCYAGGGFRVGEPQRTTLTLADQTIPATRLHAEMPGRPEPITYWTVLGDEVQADAWAWRWNQLRQGLGGHVPDGMLVRVSSIDGDDLRAWSLHAEFADALVRALAPADRVRVIGRAAPSSAR